MTKNLTEGSPLRLILLFSLPLLFGNLFQQAYNLVDTIIVGQYVGATALGAVGSTGSFQFLVLGFCGGLTVGFTIPIAQRFGAQDYGNMRKFIYTGSLLLVAFAVVITVLCSIFCNQILKILHIPQDIYKDAYDYLLIIVLGIPFLFLYNYVAGIMRAIGDSKTPFYFLVVATVLNIALDICFIVPLKLGVKGAALATIIAQSFSGILSLAYMKKKFDILKFNYSEKKFELDKCRTLIFLGAPMGLQFSITAIGGMVIGSANNSLGSLYTSGFTTGGRIKMLLICPYDAFGTAVSTFASQNYGAGKLDRIKKGVVQGTLVSVFYGFIASLILVLFSRPLCCMFISSKETEILNLAVKYSVISGFFYWLLGILNVLRPTIQGLGFSSRAFFSGVVEMFARSAVAFGLVPMFKYTAICYADPSAWISAVVYIIPTAIYCIKKLSDHLAEFK